MKTDELINFFNVCKFQSFNKAASELFLSRQALQRSITSLESSLNKKLFSRSSTGVELTDFGKVFYERAVPVLEQLSALEDLPKEYDRATKNHITFGIRGTFGSAYVIRKICKEFMEIHPDISIEIISLENHEIETLIVDETIDMAYSILPTTLEGISSEKLLDIEMCVVMDKKHDLAKYDKIKPEQLEGYEYMVHSFSHHTANLFKGYAKQANIVPNIIFTTADSNLLYSCCVQDGIVGVSIVRDAWMGEALYDDITKRTFDPPLALHQGLIYKSTKKFTKSQKQFLEYFKYRYRDANYLHKQFIKD